jgi:uncharacterized membrane protein YeaQ/YmgE (transglycosylase-associated protein family)
LTEQSGNVLRVSEFGAPLGLPLCGEYSQVSIPRVELSPSAGVVRAVDILGTPMNLSNESLLVIIIVGVVAGWLAGQIVDGGGFGLIGDLIVGILGAFVGDWLVPRLGVHLGVGTLSLVVNATIGAIVLLLILRLVAGNRGWGGGWGNGWGGRWGRRW